MRVFQVRDGGADRVSNVRYFWIEEFLVGDGWDDNRLLSNVLLLSDDYVFASFNGKHYRVCECCLDEDDEECFVKVWESDPFVDCLPENMRPFPVC